MKNTTFRVAWIIPNIFLYLMVIGLASFIIINAEGLREIDRMGIWALYLMLLLAVAIFGSFRIWTWIKQGEM
ncbi:hypothetical protein MKY84_03090 [Chryseomicrobium sp. FSL W7-1435]|uniref:hypothetical protein n=1 Tax=Chryseomicrobium sp. FSL W7-1435 TaxID=2921704 RepID=UPI00315A9BAA